MHNSPPIDRRLLGDDARHRLPSRPHIIICEDGIKQKEVTVIERNHCCQGCGRKCSSEDRTVFLILLGVVLMSLAYFFLRTHKHSIQPTL